MNRIYKYNLSEHLLGPTGFATDHPVIRMPKGAHVLTVQVQRDAVMLWAVVDPDAEVVDRTFVIVGTGQPIPDDAGRYVGTWQILGGDLVFHLFESET